jgi:hypothetical protein
MKGMLTVLGRELTEWRLLFLVASIAGLIPLAVPWLPNPGGLEPAEMRDGTALGLALVASAVLAVVLGSSVLARDLSERRLGFYFVRPLSGAAIWGGKMLGAAILVVGSGVLVLLPTWLAGGHFAPAANSGVPAAVNNLAAVLQLVLGVLLLLVTAHAVSVMVRSRSPWLVLDLVALAVVAAVLWSCRRLLRSEAAFGAAEMMQIAFAGAALIATAIAGLIQVVRGRTDLRRGHRLLSLVLWSSLGAAALGGAAYTRWVLGATPRDLVDFREVVPAPSGSWIAIGGRTARRFGYEPAFLLDLASGRFVKIHADLEAFGLRNPVFSQDESRAVWLTRSAGEGYVLSTLDLRRPGAVPVRTSVSYQERPRTFAVSPDGSRVAALWSNRVTVDDLRTGRMLVSQALPDDLEFNDRLRFVSPGHLWIFRSAETKETGGPPVWRLTALDLEIETRRITLGNTIETTGRNWGFNLSPDGSHALLYRYPVREIRLADLRTGSTRTLAASGARPYEVRFLSDGRLTLAELDKQRIILRLLSPEGANQLEVSLPGSRLLVGGQPSPDLLAVATVKAGSFKEFAAWTSWLVDLRTAKVRKIDQGLLPTILGPREPGSLPSRMFYRGRGDLLLFDPATGKLRTVLPGADRSSDAPDLRFSPFVQIDDD